MLMGEPTPGKTPLARSRRDMSLDIGVGDGTHPTPISGEPFLQMEDGALYAFLFPYFERLAAQTSGRLIDLYGDASFEGPRLALLKQTIAAARRDAESRPESWKVHVGTQIAPIRRRIIKPVTRAELLNCLDRWDEIIARAEKLGRPVVCFGD
jgi:hypothetical protein